jgi:hypothetical protein
MDERARRIGLNEAMFRTVNEQIEELNKQLAGISDRTMHVVCECGDAECMERLVVSLDDYERIRGDSTLFLVAPGHEIPQVEDVVEQEQEWTVVRKKPGPAALAEETDPRS